MPAMTRKEFVRMLADLAHAWSRRDYARAAAAFAPDIQYGDPTRYGFSDRDALRAFFEADEGYEQRTVWHHILFDEEQQLGAAEYTYEGTHRYHGLVLIRMAGDLIQGWREYQHIDSRAWEDFIRRR